MATYKKKSVKTKSSLKAKNIESTKQVFDTLDDSASKTETFVNQYPFDNKTEKPLIKIEKIVDLCIIL